MLMKSAGAVLACGTAVFAAPATLTSSGAGSPTATIDGSKAVASLWARVEANSPIVKPSVTTLQRVPSNYSYGNEPPPYTPDWLKSGADEYKFPKGFFLGASTAATQVEGDVKADGKGPTGWDWQLSNGHVRFADQFPSACSNQTADVTTNHYNMYPVDLARMKKLEMNAYSFSVQWARILPTGSLRTGGINEAGLKFASRGAPSFTRVVAKPNREPQYDKLIAEASKNGLTPFLTMFHFDLPMGIMLDYGSILDTSGKFSQDWFAYTDILFRRYGQKITRWITINEPGQFCHRQLPNPIFNVTTPQGVTAENAQWICVHNMLKAHGAAVQHFRYLQKKGLVRKDAQISYKADEHWPLPYRTGNAEDLKAAQRHADFNLGIFAQPVFGDGNYPQSIRDTLGNVLPALTAAEKKMIKGSGDFFAWNGYATTAAMGAPTGVENCARNPSDLNWPMYLGGHISISTRIHQTTADILHFRHDVRLFNSVRYTRRMLKYISEKYPTKGGIYITEFGFSPAGEAERQNLAPILWDEARQIYYRNYLTELLYATNVDKIDVRGALAWSILDNFEWQAGMGTKFGLTYVDTKDPQLARTFKLSAYQWRDFARQHLRK
ncbi:hypothetical protein OIV83_004468 [Microbotryomycetes sp. JL201]|nr:hypothetical protein OIV83_004468 [Microbotryomycetes sp. JL201]